MGPEGGRFRVTLLGTGNPRPLMERFGPSTLVDVGTTRLLFDCGRGATQRLFQLGVPLADANLLFLTHLHSDHVVGLPDLWLTGWIFGREAPLLILGPEGTKEMAADMERAFQFDVAVRRDKDERLPAAGAVLQADDVVPGVVFEGTDVRVTAFEVDHGPVRPALGYRIDAGGRSVVLSGDTRLSEEVIRQSEGVDLLVHEVAALGEGAVRDRDLIDRVLAHHISPEEAGEVFMRAAPQLAVYSHLVLLGGIDTEELVRRTRTTYSGPLEVGEDLMELDVGAEVGVTRHMEGGT